MVPAFARATHASAIEQRRLFDHGRAMVVPLSVSMMAATIGGAYLAGWIFIEQTGIDAALITAILAVGWLATLATSTDRKSVVSGKSVSVRVDLGGRRIIKKKKMTTPTINIRNHKEIQ